MKKIYVAAPMFSEADREYNEKLTKRIEELDNIESIYLPQRNAAINDKKNSANSVQIYDGDTQKLLESDILVALLDGSDIDAGVASEIGFCAGMNESMNLPMFEIYALFTDSRDFSVTASRKKVKDSKSGVAESQFPYRNLYTVGCCKKWGKVVSSADELLNALKESLKIEKGD